MLHPARFAMNPEIFPSGFSSLSGVPDLCHAAEARRSRGMLLRDSIRPLGVMGELTPPRCGKFIGFQTLCLETTPRISTNIFILKLWVNFYIMGPNPHNIFLGVFVCQ